MSSIFDRGYEDIFRKLAELASHYKAFLIKTPDFYTEQEDGKRIHIMVYKEYVAEHLTKEDLFDILKDFMIYSPEIKVGD